MSSWRRSTWVYLLAVVAATVAEVIYATSDDPYTQALQYNAWAGLIVVSVIFAFYRGVTRDRERRPTR